MTATPLRRKRYYKQLGEIQMNEQNQAETLKKVCENRWVSIADQRGKFATQAVRVQLFDILQHIVHKNANVLGASKDDSYLLFGGFMRETNQYPRKELEGMVTQTVWIDVDNPQGDKKLLEKFQELYKNLTYIIYHSASSTADRPRFRAIFPLDRAISHNKYTKKAIKGLFRDFADEAATWYYLPTIDKAELIINEGRYLPAKDIADIAKLFIQIEEEEQKRYEDYLKYLKYTKGTHLGKDSWLNMPSVRYCLEFLSNTPGERDKRINYAVYALKMNGYGAPEISQFLDLLEDKIEHSLLQKIRRQYKVI